MIQQQWFAELLQHKDAPCVSIYMPVHRAAPITDEDSIRYRANVDKACATLAHRWDDKVCQQMKQRLLGALTGSDLTEGARDGVAVFCSPSLLRVINLQEDPKHAVDELVIVADSFHVKPLIRLMQGADRFQLLCLEIKEVRLFEGSKFDLEPVQLKNVPQNPEEVSGMRVSKDVDSATDLQESPRQQAQAKGQVEPVPVEIFFRAVDKAIWENHSRSSKLPLILCCDPKYADVFLSHSQNQYLLKRAIPINPHRQSLDRLHEEAWKLMEPQYLASIDKLRNDFRAAKAHHQGSDELMEVAQATSAGRVGTLLVQADAQIRGILSRADGFIRSPEITHPSDDVLDDLAEMVLQMDGRVVVLPRDSMPTDTGVAAIYRY
jgi:hypothetical protein